MTTRSGRGGEQSVKKASPTSCAYEEAGADLFTSITPPDYSLGHCLSQDLKIPRGITKIFRNCVAYK
ncbi:unnamed protein product [Acanthoscelides obtectus]|uniref:Uncharacterized protein n=1 Tax=Acanthoscelides obtectus TaxID=200917 RepID=A0A9P0P939_ACAOB|nr:unnamed protein product [Acanthoscelides obtectus]CAK1657539.1 hypothetical protein AOBTE_LOCUS20407 [Acanthoscelides obtectus]